MSVNQHPPKFENVTYEFLLSGDEVRQSGIEESWKVVITDEDGAKNGAPFHCSLNGKDANHFTVSLLSQPFLSSQTQNHLLSFTTVPHFCAIQPVRSTLSSGTYNFELQAVDSGEKVRWATVPISVKVQTHSQPNTNNKDNSEPSADKTQSLSLKGLIWLMDMPESHSNFNRRILELSPILTSPTSPLHLEPTSGYLYNLNTQSQPLQNFFAVEAQTGVVYLRGNPFTRMYNLGVEIQETAGNQLEGGESPPETPQKYEILLNFEVFSVFDEEGSVKAPWRIAGLRVPGNMARAYFYMTDQYRDRIWSLLSEKMERPGMTLKDITIRSAALTQMEAPGKSERAGRDASDIFILFHTVKTLNSEDISRWNLDMEHVKKDLEKILLRNVTYLHHACQSKCLPLGSPCETQFQAQSAMDGGNAYESYVLGQTAYVIPRLKLVSQCKSNKDEPDKTSSVDSSEKGMSSSKAETRQQKVFLVSSLRDTTWQMDLHLLPLRTVHCFLRWTRKSSGKLLQIETDMEHIQLFLEKGDLAYKIVSTALGETAEPIKRHQGVLSSLMSRVNMEGGGISSQWILMRVTHRDSVTCADEWNSDSNKCTEWRILVGSMERSFQSRQTKTANERQSVSVGWKIRWGSNFNIKEVANSFEKPLHVEEESLACVKEIYLNEKEWNYWRGRGLISLHNGGLVERDECSIQGCQMDSSEEVVLPCQAAQSNKEVKLQSSSNQCPSAVIQCHASAAHNCLSQSEVLSCLSEINAVDINSLSTNVTCQCHTESTTQSLSCQMLPPSSVVNKNNLFIHKNCPQIPHSPGKVSQASQLQCFVTKEIRRQQLRCLSHNPYSNGFNVNNHESAAMAPSQTFAGLHQHPLFPVPVAILGFLALLIALLLFLKIRQRRMVLRRKRSQRIRNSNLHSPASQDDSPTHLPSPHKLLLSMPSSYSPQGGAGIISPANILPPNAGCHYCDACTYCPPYQGSLPNHMQASTLSHSSRSFWDYVSMLEPQPGTNHCTDGSLSPLCLNHTPHIGRLSTNYLQHLHNTTMSSNASGNTAEVASILFNPNSGTPTPMIPHGAATLPMGVSSSIPINNHVQSLEYGLPITPTDSELMTISRQSTKLPQYWSPCQIETLPVSMNSQSDFSSTCEPHFEHVSFLPNLTVTPCFPRQHKDTNQLILNDCRVNFPSPKDSETWPHNNNSLLY